MDDSCAQEKQTKNRLSLSGIGNFLQSIRFRHPFRFDHEMDELLLAYNFNFLLPFGFLLWAVLFFIK